MVAKGDLIELEIASSAYQGRTVGRYEGLAIFVPYAVPGDKAKVRILRRKKSYAEGVIEELIEASPDRVQPRCPYFGVCGGCTLQSADYERQLEYKRGHVGDLFQRVGGLEDVNVEETLRSPSIYYYRNKMEFSFGGNRWLTKEEISRGGELPKGFALGLHIPKRFDKILDLETCYLQSELTPRIVNWTRQYCQEQGWTPYHARKQCGFLRNLVIRTGTMTGDVMVNLVTTRREPQRLERMVEALRGPLPEVSVFVNTINSTLSPVGLDEEIVLLGEDHIREKIEALTIKVAPTSFFQPNTRQAGRLYSLIREMGRLQSGDTLYDLYCGVGSIGLFLSSVVERVVGVESQPLSVAMARENARFNGCTNCHFYVGDAVEALSPEFVRANGRPDVLVLDPPRAGLHPEVGRRLLEVLPERVVYTSCNPATQARDLSVLSQGYQILRVKPVDMFPQTYHIESVVALQRRAARAE
jgi:23S rRNA (uracil1939-C5)-methyltransferase